MSGQNRESYVTRWGFVLGVLGGAIGLGNVWRFSYMAGMNGGGAFFAPYIFLLIVVAFPALMLEFAYGRHFRGGPVEAHAKAGLPGGKVFGWLVIIMTMVTVSYYMVLISWTLKYFIASFSDTFWAAEPKTYFNHYVDESRERFVFHSATVLICMFVAILGIRKGVEPITKILLLIFFIFIFLLACYALTLPGAGAGLQFLFYPDFAAITPEIWLMALAQVSFSLGMGGGVFVTYGSYMSDKFSIPAAAGLIVTGDLIAAVLCGIVIFPGVFTIGADPAGGVGLVFFILPEVLSQVPYGPQLVGPMFYFSFFAAAISTGLFTVEFLSEPLIYRLKMKRTFAVPMVTLIVWLPGLLWCYNMDWLTKLDIINAVLSRPLFGLLVPIAFLWIYSAKKAHEEVNKNVKYKVGVWWPVWAKYGLPTIIIFVYFSGIWNFFNK